MILAKDKGDSLRVTPFSRREESSLIHRVTCRLGSRTSDSDRDAA